MTMKSMLKMLMLLLTFSEVAFGECCNYPTKWFIHKEDDQVAYMECFNQASGLPEGIKMSVTISQTDFTHVWSNWYYNDGLGLNGGTWICAVSNRPNPMSNHDIQRSRFDTDWGENVSLRLVPVSRGYKVERY
jgi:hypothetical protein